MKTNIQMFFLVLAILVNGCSYTSRNVLPDHITRIHLRHVKNSTNYSGLSEKLTSYLSRELASDNRVFLSDKAGADARLTIEIYDYQKIAVDIDDRGHALEYEVTITARVTLFDQVKNEVFWQEEYVNSSADYTANLSSSADIVSEAEAVDEAIDNLAADIAHRVIYGW